MSGSPHVTVKLKFPSMTGGGSEQQHHHLSPQPPSSARPNTSSSASASASPHSPSARARPNTTSSSSSQPRGAPISMSEQIGFALGEQKLDMGFSGAPDNSSGSFHRGASARKPGSTPAAAAAAAASGKQPLFTASPERQRALLSGLPGLSQTVTTTKAYAHDARKLSEALAKWRGPVRGPEDESSVMRRIAMAGRVPHTMANSVLTMIEVCGGQEFAEQQRKSLLHGEEDVNDFVTELPFLAGADRKERMLRQEQQQQRPAATPGAPASQRNRRRSVVVETATGDFERVDEDELHSRTPKKDPQQAALEQHLAEFRLACANKYPPRHHRPAQRDFLSWSSGAALSFDGFASVNRWVEWVLREAEFHARRIAGEHGNKALTEDALDLAEVMKSNFDNLLVDTTTFYEEIKQRAAEINDCVKSWSRAREFHQNNRMKQQQQEQRVQQQHQSPSSPSSARKRGTDAHEHDDDDDAENDAKNLPPLDTAGEPFLIRAAFLVLDRVLTSSSNMKFLWPRIRNALLRGLFVDGEDVMSAALREAESNNSSNKKKDGDGGGDDAQQLHTDALPRALATHALIAEQYDELLLQFREAERQRFHLESTTSQLSAFSDLTARHSSRRLIRSAFRAWRAVAQAGKVHERLIVHFARQAKARELCGRTLHRWRSYTQLQRRVRAVKQADEVRRRMAAVAAEHDEVLAALRDEHRTAVSGYEIKILQLEQQYDAALEGAALEREMAEKEITRLHGELDRAQHLAQQWRTAALLSRPTEGPDAVALVADDEEQRRAVVEMSLALSPPSRKLQLLISAVRGAEDALYLATIRAATSAQEQQMAKAAALRRQVDALGGNNTLASPTAASLARSLSGSRVGAGAESFFASSTNLAARRLGSAASPNSTVTSLEASAKPKRGRSKDGKNGKTSGGGNKLEHTVSFSPIIEHGLQWSDLPAMDFNEKAAAAAAAAAGNESNSNNGSPTSLSMSGRRGADDSPKPAFRLFVKPEGGPLLGATLNATVTGIASGSDALSRNLRSANTNVALQQRPELNFQALAAAARESLQSFLVEWVNEILAKHTAGRTVMHAGVQRSSSGTTEARRITNLTTDLYDGSVYLLLCKAIMPAEHQRRGEADVFSTLVSTLFVFTAHGLQPPLIVHCPFYRRFFRADTFNTFIHPTGGMWIVASLFCGYALRTAQAPQYRGHPALAPVQQYSPGGRHKVTKTAAAQRQAGGTLVARPPLNILIMSGINTCGYGTKRATASTGPQGDAMLLHKLGVSVDKTVNVNKSGDSSNDPPRDAADDGADDQQQHNDGDDTRRRNGRDAVDFGDRASSSDGAEEDRGRDDDLEGCAPEDAEDVESDLVDEIDEMLLPGAEASSPLSQSTRSPRGRRNLNKSLRSNGGGGGAAAAAASSSPTFDANAWLDSVAAMEAARKAVPEPLLDMGPSELLQYWRSAQENRSIWTGMARVITSLVVRFRVLDVDTKRTEQNTMRRHLQPHMTSTTMTAELKVEAHKAPGGGAM